MNITLDYKKELQKVERELGELQRKAIPRAANSTNNKTAVTARKETVKELGKTMSKDIGLGASGFRKAIDIKKSTVKTLVAILSAHGRPLPLALFVQPSKRKPGFFNQRIYVTTKPTFAYKGVEAKAWNKKKTYKHSFIAKTKSGHVGVFVRSGKKRTPIKELYGPSIPSEFLNEKVQKHLKRTIEQKWKPVFDRELAYYLSKFNG